MPSLTLLCLHADAVTECWIIGRNLETVAQNPSLKKIRYFYTSEYSRSANDIMKLVRREYGRGRLCELFKLVRIQE